MRFGAFYHGSLRPEAAALIQHALALPQIDSLFMTSTTAA
jgi:hypothetical protein